MSTDKLVTIKEAKRIALRHRSDRKKVVLVTGCFDIIHFGHVQFFRFARSLGDVLIVGLDNDENVRLNKKEGRPLFPFIRRAEVLSALEPVDYIFEITDVVRFNTDEADAMLHKVISTVGPDVFVIHLDKDEIQKRKTEICKRANVQLVIDENPKTVSSSRVLDLLLKET